MAELNQKYKELMKDLESNIQNKEDLEYIKNKMSSFFMVFLEEMDETMEFQEEKINVLIQNQKELTDKIDKMEKIVNGIAKDIYEEEEESYDFEIVCPYCNHEFVTELDELKDEIKCPECKNVIELDWNNEEDGCEGNCSCCHGHCEEDSEEDDLEDEEDEIDDDEDEPVNTNRIIHSKETKQEDDTKEDSEEDDM